MRSDVVDADIIFVMEDHHREYFDRHHSNLIENVFLIKTFATGGDKPKNVAISDPIGQSIKVYRKTINQIEKELDRILPQLEKLINNKLQK